MGQKVKDVGEFQLIQKLIRFNGSSRRVVKGIGDDAAVLQLDARRYALVTTDMLVEGVHFLPTAQPKLLGHKALACNISDIAAMGGLPGSAVVSIGLPPTLLTSYVRGIYAGMSQLAREFDVSIVGGDTVRADQLVINVALWGTVEKHKVVLRSGAQPGDIIFVSGSLGNTLSSGKHLKFIPRIKESRFLVDHFKPSAMIDISDGLAGDLGHILKASGVGALIDADKIPLNRGASLDSALTGGEDFELLFTLPLAQARKLIKHVQKNKEFSFAGIGTITDAVNRLRIRDSQGRIKNFIAKAYTHFQ